MKVFTSAFLCRVTHVDLVGVLGTVWVPSRLAGIWVVADETNCGDSAIRGNKLGQMTWAAHKNLFHSNFTHLYTISK